MVADGLANGLFKYNPKKESISMKIAEHVFFDYHTRKGKSKKAAEINERTFEAVLSEAVQMKINVGVVFQLASGTLNKKYNEKEICKA
jgi:hypothetical protein